MKLLLDSHTLIWAVDEPSKITAVAAAALQDPGNDLIVSIVSIWEIALKVAKGRLPLSLLFRDWIVKAISDLGLAVMPMTIDHAERQIAFPFHHRDPFDRLLAAQSLAEGIAIVGGDTMFDAYGVHRIW